MTSQTSTATEHLTNLRERIVTRFNLEEVRLLAFDLNVNYDDLRGETISGKTQALLERLHHQERIPDLLSRLKQLRPGEEWDNLLPAEPDATSPYKGLLYFDEADAPRFFGREQVTAELIAHLRQRRFLAVVGASGSGKSSVVRAGVIPAIRRGEISGEQGSSATWPIHVITPGDEPLKALAATLTRDSESVTATKTLLADLQTDTDSLDLFIYRHMGGVAGRLLLIVDQFEELFTQCRDAAAREQFVGNLVTAVTRGQQGRLSLILTLRADFYAYAVQMEALRPLLETHQKIIGAMTPDELRQTIEGPAAKGNWALQPGLVKAILQDVGREPGALPLLSHAMQETWARREGRTLTLAGYQAAGGVRKAIAQTADAVYASLTPEQQVIARNIFLRLTELGEGTEDTRRRAALTELLPEGEGETAVLDLLDMLARKRLVTLSEETAQPHAEVSHEALIRAWPALRSWLDENREGLRLQRQITEAAQAWQVNGEDASYLYRGGRLAQAQEWMAQPGAQLNPLERRFLAISRENVVQEEAEREVQRQRELAQAQQLAEAQTKRVTAVRRAFVGIFALFIVAVGAAIFGFAQRNIALERANTAQSLALASASLSVQEKDLMRGLLLAIAAGQTANTALAYDALHGTLPPAAILLHTLQHDTAIRGMAWNRDESMVLTWSNDGTVRIWDTASGRERLSFSHNGRVNSAVWNGDESLILTASNDRTARVWDAASGEERLRLSHKGVVSGATWNGDESRILTWSEDNTARVWDAASGIEQLRLSHEGWVRGATWNGNESRILTWGGDNTVRVWNAASGVERLRLGHDHWAYGAAWNGDESLILTWSEDGTARVWKAASGVEMLRLSHTLRVRGATWNGDESLILTWNDDNTARVWDTASGAERLRLSHEGVVRGATWNGNESRILTWSDDNTARVWEVDSGAERLRLSHEGWVSDAAWSGNESRILTWSEGNTARVWDAASGIEQLRLSHEGVVSGATWNRDESRILTWSGDGTARLWDTASSAGRLRLSHEGGINGAAWNGDESLILTWSRGGTARVWDATSGDKRLRLSHEGVVRGAAWNGDENRILTWSDDKTARLWDAVSGAERLRLIHDGSVLGATWSADESRILTWSVDTTARVWGAASGAGRLRLIHDGSVWGATWNGDESRILTWSGDGTARVWDAASGAEWLRLIHDGSVWGATWNGDESRILTWSGDGTARLWDAANGDERLRLNHESGVNGAAWNGDESRILTWSGDGTARVWGTANGTEWLRLSHNGSVSGAGWNEDGSRILTWSGDGAARVWDAATGAVLVTLNGDGTPVVAAQWSRDERRILLVTQTGFVGSYYTQMADLLDAACQRATRNFTWAEWQLYFPGQPYRIICDQWPVHDSVPEGES